MKTKDDLTRKDLNLTLEEFCNGDNENLDTESINAGVFRKSSNLDVAIEHACNDMMARTLKVKTDEDKGEEKGKKKGGKAFKDDVKKYLKDRMKAYFNSDNYEADKFDGWHNDTCIKVLDIINQHYEARYGESEKVKYGKAQKIVNMTFKYLYCFAEEEERKNYFNYCHMPIDSYILKWLEDGENLKILNEMDEYKDLNLKLKKSKFSRWSNLQNPKTNDIKPAYDDNGYYTYSTVCEMIRKLVKKNYGGKFTPLEAEFFIWKQMKEQA